jgi:hypothetical protein
MEKNPTITVSDCGLPYDYEDFGMDIPELQAKYAEEHPEYTRAAFANSKDDSDYWTWVLKGIAQDDEDY